MDRSNLPFFFESDSEDSDSSSSSEKERKKALLQQQTQTEIIKPTEISIEAHELQALVTRIGTIAKLNNNIETLDENFNLNVCKFLTLYAREMLFTYSIDGKIIADFTLPNDSTNIMFFVKLITNEDPSTNLSKSIIFGSLDTNIHETLISSLKMVFVCSFYNTKTLPYRIKRRLTKNIEDVLIYLTESYYRDKGISEIYLPALNFFETEQISSFIRTDDRINSLENVVVQWCHVLSEAIHDNEIDFFTVIDFSVSTLLYFWKYRFHNLFLISKCLNDTDSIELREILRNYNSVHLKFLSELEMKLQDKIAESSEIISYLQLLEDIHRQLHSCKIENILTVISESFRMINTITTQSPYFKVEKNADLLVNGVSNQMISVCQQYFNIEDILEGETAQSMENIIESVKICYLYSELLKFRGIISSLESKNFLSIHSYVETFIKRCSDLLELCSMINIFQCSQNNGRPVYITIEQHIEVEENLKLIYQRFDRNLDQIREIREKILYVRCTEWCTVANRFQNTLLEIENQIRNFTDKAFVYVSTAEDELNVLRVTYHYSKLNSLKTYFIYKNDQMIDNLLQEIKEIEQCIFLNTVKPLISPTSILDLVICTSLKKRRLQFLHQIISDSKWLSCNSLDTAKTQFQENIVIHNQYIINAYKRWLEKGNVAVSQLKRPLVAKCFYKSGLLEVNIDRKLLKIMKESRIWIQVGLKLPTNLEKLVHTFAQILILYGNVADLVMNYNRIISGLSVAEYLLFSEIINICTETISPTLYTMHWDYEQSNETVLNYLKHVKFVENTINKYKNYNKQIIDTCKSICSINFLTVVQHNIDFIKTEIYTNRLVCLKKIINCYNRIASIIQALFDSFSHHIYKMKQIWNLYVEKIDFLMEHALETCIRNSLTSLLFNISSNCDLDNDSLVKIIVFVAVEDEKIKFKPDLNEILTFFSHLHTIILKGMKVVPRIYNKFKLSKENKKISYAEQLTTNQTVTQLQQQIISVIHDNLSQLKEHLKVWNRFRNLWKIDVAEYARLYCSKCTSASNYRTDFHMYLSIIQEIENSKHIEQISLFTLNTEELSEEIITRCQNRLKHLSNALKGFVINMIKKIKTHISESDLELNTKTSSNDYLDCIKNLNSQVSEQEKEISQIQDYINTLRQFKLQDNLVDQQEDMMNAWRIYLNTLERHKLKAKITYDVQI